jgi:hypothetical protein
VKHSALVLVTLSGLVFPAYPLADDVRVSIEWPDSLTAEVQITDDLGPLNSWESLTADVFDPSKGTFVNQGQVGTARGCGSKACWSLDAFDIDVVQVGNEGIGVVNFAVDDSRISEIKWSVLAVN